MGKKGKDIQRGQDAKRFTEDPLYKKAFEETKEQLIEMLLQTKISEEDERDRIYITIKSLGLIDEHIKSVLNTGKLAEGQEEFY
jgi:ABC-type antimicrobial peptide transport system ATPase subunit